MQEAANKAEYRNLVVCILYLLVLCGSFVGSKMVDLKQLKCSFRVNIVDKGSG